MTTIDKTCLSLIYCCFCYYYYNYYYYTSATTVMLTIYISTRCIALICFFSTRQRKQIRTHTHTHTHTHTRTHTHTHTKQPHIMWNDNNTTTALPSWNNDISNDNENHNRTNSAIRTDVTTASVLGALFRFALSTVIVGLNSLTILTFCRTKVLRTLSNMLTVSLAVTDLMVGVMVLVSALNLIPVINSVLTLSAAFCVVRLSFFFLCCSVSMMTVCLIAAERYLFIVHPYKHVDYVNAKVGTKPVRIIYINI